MNKDLSRIFLTNVNTKIEALRRLRLLKGFLNQIFFEQQSKVDIKQSIDRFFEVSQDASEFIEVDKAFFLKLGDDFYKQFNTRTLNKQLEELEATLNQVKGVIVYLPIELPQTEVEKMGQWFKVNVGEQTIMDIQYDPTLIGGAAFSYNGVLKDYSLRARITTQKEMILQTLLSFKEK